MKGFDINVIVVSLPQELMKHLKNMQRLGMRECRMIVTSAITADEATDSAICFARLIKENSENTRVRPCDDKVIESEEEQVPGEKGGVEENSETEPLPNPVSLSTIPNPVSLSTLPNPEAGHLFNPKARTLRRSRSFSSRESREPPRESRESRDDTRRFRPRSRSASQHRGRFRSRSQSRGRSRYDKGRREQSEEMLADVLTKDSVKNTERVDGRTVRHVIQSMGDALDRGEVGEFEYANTKEMLADVLARDSVRNAGLHDTVKYGSLPKNISDISETESGKFVRDPRS